MPNDSQWWLQTDFVLLRAKEVMQILLVWLIACLLLHLQAGTAPVQTEMLQTINAITSTAKLLAIPSVTRLCDSAMDSH